jgi:hypothetical protein
VPDVRGRAAWPRVRDDRQGPSVPGAPAPRCGAPGWREECPLPEVPTSDPPGATRDSAAREAASGWPSGSRPRARSRQSGRLWPARPIRSSPCAGARAESPGLRRRLQWAEGRREVVTPIEPGKRGHGIRGDESSPRSWSLWSEGRFVLPPARPPTFVGRGSFGGLHAGRGGPGPGSARPDPWHSQRWLMSPARTGLTSRIGVPSTASR